MEFIPFSELKSFPEEVVVVDAHHPSAIDLSHWRGAVVDEALKADTSAEIALKAIKANHHSLQRKFVTNNHFDIDGFLGIWAMINPEKAIAHYELLKEMALIGDFREINFEYAEWKKALKLVCWINQTEASLFYPPFGAPETLEKEMIACVPKYEYFLKIFQTVLDSFNQMPDPAEYSEIMGDLNTAIERFAIADIRMQVIRAQNPLHYYSLFARSYDTDIVLSQFEGNRYELELKYTTWVYTERNSFPRISLATLRDKLNSLETSGRKWVCDHYTDTGPILRLDGKKLSKKERFGSPNRRPIYSSSIEPNQFVKECEAYFRKYYAKINERKEYSWAELRQLNEAIFKR